jgi:hypothetical protein
MDLAQRILFLFLWFELALRVSPFAVDVLAQRTAGILLLFRFKQG